MGLCYSERREVEPITQIGNLTTYEDREGNAYLVDSNTYDPDVLSKVGLIVGDSIAVGVGLPAAASGSVLGMMATVLGVRDVTEGVTGRDPVIEGLTQIVEDRNLAENLTVVIDFTVIAAEILITPASAAVNLQNANKFASDLDVVTWIITTGLTTDDLINDIEAAKDD